MSQRLKVLMSAYACEPGKGSEPEVGWQWALQMARFHDVTVVTRANNQPVIEPALAALRGKQPLPNFVYHDRGPFFLDLKRRAKAVKLYYLLWQKSAHEVVARLHQKDRFDLMHHVTFAGFRYPVAIWGHGVPCIWGPIGGIESIPTALLPWHHPVSLVHELFRNANNLLQATPFHVLPKRARASTLILVSTPEMQRTFARLGSESHLVPTIGLKTNELPFEPHRRTPGPLKLLFVGNIITLKGIDLALAALKASGVKASFTLVGSGNFEAQAKQQAAALGLGDQVQFLGRLPREEVLRLYPEYDVFFFPSLHDTGGYAVIEAMFNELPVICLDCGGPGVAVRENCGVKVPLGSRAKVIAGLAQAIQHYDQNRPAIEAQGRAARAAVLNLYDWDQKGVRMEDYYQLALDRNVGGRVRRTADSPMGSMTNLAHGMFSFRGLMASLLLVVLIGAGGFLSLRHLKSEADLIVNDTLPSLSFTGEANASLAAAFNRTLMYLLADTEQERARFRNETEKYSNQTAFNLTAYEKTRFSPKEKALLNTALKARQEYIQIRKRIFELADQGKKPEAIALCNRELLPAFLRYKESIYNAFEYNVQEAKTRGQSITTVCTITQWAVAIIAVLIFIIGFLIGMFK
jgi:glycosyltransferase involved in cell wall biosynthesis